MFFFAALPFVLVAVKLYVDCVQEKQDKCKDSDSHDDDWTTSLEFDHVEIVLAYCLQVQ